MHGYKVSEYTKLAGATIESAEIEESVDGYKVLRLLLADGTTFTCEQHDYEGMGCLILDHFTSPRNPPA